MVLLKSEDILKKGDHAPDFSLKATNGKMYTLASFKAKCLLIVFMCNHCPYVKQKIKTLVELQKKFTADELQIVGVNSNDALQYPDDSFENMKKAAAAYKMNFSYLYDGAQDAAKAYGASCTPDPFLFDASRNLVFHGRLDDALDLGQKVTEHTMEENIIAVLSGLPVEDGFKPSVGCSIKWKKEELIKKQKSNTSNNKNKHETPHN